MTIGALGDDGPTRRSAPTPNRLRSSVSFVDGPLTCCLVDLRNLIVITHPSGGFDPFAHF